MTDRTPQPHRAHRSLLPTALAFVLCLASQAAAEDGSGTDRRAGVEITLPPPGVCATPRRRELALAPQAFVVSGSPVAQFVAHPVAAAPGFAAGTIDVPRPARMPLPTRSPCDVGAGACAPKQPAPFIEPPPVPGLPPGVPGGPPGATGSPPGVP